MVDENVRINADFDDLINSLQKAINFWNDYSDAQVRADRASAKFSKAGGRNVKSVSLLTDELERLNIGLKKTNEGYRVVTASLNKNTAEKKAAERQAQKLAEAQRKEAEAVRQVQQRQRAQAQARTTLGRTRQDLDVSGGSRQELFNLARAERSVAEFVEKNRIGANTAERIWKEASQGIFKTYTGRLGGLQDRLVRLRKAHEQVGNAAERYRLQVQKGFAQGAKSNIRSAEQSVRRVTEETKKANKTAQEFLLSWRSLGRLLTVQLLHQLVAKITFQLQQSAAAAKDLQISLAEIQTIDISGTGIEQWAATVRDLADTFAFGILDQAEAAYQALSNQVVDSATEFRIFGDAVNRFAAASVSSASDATNLLTGALNAFNIEVERADEVAASLFKTIELGRVRASEMANSLGNVAILASQLGVSLEELEALIATLTVQGIKYSEAATQIRGIFIKLLKPTNETKELFDELGVSSGEAAIEALGLANFLRILEQKTQGSSTEIAKYINRIRGLSGILGVTGSAFEKFESNLREIENPLESYDRAVNLVLENTGKQLEIALDRVRNFFVQDVTTDALKALERISGGFKNLADNAIAVGEFLRSLVVPALAAATAAIVKFTVGLVATTGPIGIAVAGLAAITATFKAIQIAAGNTSLQIRKSFREWQAQQVQRIKEQNKQLADLVGGIQDYFKERNRLALNAAREEIALSRKAIKDQQEGYESLQETFEDTQDAIIDKIKESIDEMEKQVKRLDGQIKDQQAKIKELRFSREQELFRERLATTPEFQRPRLIQDRIGELNRQAEQAVANRNVERFERIQAEINRLFEQRKQLLRSQIEELGGQVDLSDEVVNRVQRELDLREKLIEATRKQQEEEAKRLAEREQNLGRIRALSEKTTKFDFASVIGLESPEEIQRRIKAQNDALSQLSDLQRKAGLSVDPSIQDQIQRNRIAAEERIAEIRLNALREERDLAEERRKAAFDSIKEQVQQQRTLLNQAREDARASLASFREFRAGRNIASLQDTRLVNILGRRASGLDPTRENTLAIETAGREFLKRFDENLRLFTSGGKTARSVIPDLKILIDAMQRGTENQEERIKAFESLRDSLQSIVSQGGVNNIQRAIQINIEALEQYRINTEAQKENTTAERESIKASERLRQSIDQLKDANEKIFKFQQQRELDRFEQFGPNGIRQTRINTQLIPRQTQLASAAPNTTNVGGITINYQSSGNTDIDVVELGNRLRTEIRRGRVALS